MLLKDQSMLRIVLFEGRDAQSLPSEKRFAALKELLGRGFAVTRVANDGAVSRADKSSLVVLGHFAGGHAPEPATAGESVPARIHDITTLDANQITELVEAARVETQAARSGEWKPWFPVIDFDRCTNCMQCLSFCLFGVYGVNAGQQIEVQSAESCKTNCPACSRVCPEAAIIFPKYKSGPINGDVVSDADLAREKMKIDISALLGGDIYSLLRERSEKAKSRFSKERDANKALQERQKCLAKLVQAAEIPPEVLMALPSPEEIQRRAEEAKAKAQAALARQT